MVIHSYVQSRLSKVTLARPVTGTGHRSQGGGGGGGVRADFGGTPNFIKRGKTLHRCARKRRVLVLNSYLDPPTFQNHVSAPESMGGGGGGGRGVTKRWGRVPESSSTLTQREGGGRNSFSHAEGRGSVGGGQQVLS